MITKNQIKYICSLHLKKNRDTHNCFVVEGEKIVNELLRSDFNVKAIFATKDWIQSVKKAIEIHIIPLYYRTTLTSFFSFILI